MNHTLVGDITETKFALYCMEHDVPISKPLNNNLPYDFIIDTSNKLLKVQVKTGYENNTNKGFMFNTRSTSKNYNECTTKSYDDLIDGFVVWYKELPNNFFYVPVEKAAKGTMTMYFGDNPKSNQNYVWDYNIDVVLV